MIRPLTVALAALAVMAPAAHGATTLGQLPGTTENCGSGMVFLQYQTGPAPSYTIPAGGGVVTAWRTKDLRQADGQIAALKLLTETSADNFKVVGNDGPRPVAAGTVTYPNASSTAAVRVPVSGGELVGLWLGNTSNNYSCYFDSGNAPDIVKFTPGSVPTNPQVNSTLTTPGSDSPSHRLNLQVVLEPDADKDGFGDETQDECPTDKTRRGPCPFGETGGGPVQLDSTVPVLVGRATASPSVFEVDPRGRAETPVAVATRGTRFRYRLSEPATTTFVISRRTRGRRVGRRCRRQTRRNRRRRRCIRYVRVGAFEHQGVAGLNSKRFSGRIGRRRLRPARYRATLTAVDAATNRSRARRIGFRVVRPARRRGR